MGAATAGAAALPGAGFSGLRVVEAGEGPAVAYCGRLFADLGATVIKIESPDGADIRRVGPFPAGSVSPDTGALHLFLDAGKQSAVIDTESGDGQATLAALARGADLLVHSFSAGAAGRFGLAADSLRAAAPRLVVLSLTYFGLSGPYAGYTGSPLVAFALGGQLFLSGEPDREPIPGPGWNAEYQAALHGAVAALAALLAVPTAGGQQVEVSVMESMQLMHEWTLVRYTHGGVIQSRMGNVHPTLHPVSLYPCLDGYVGITAVNDEQFVRLCEGIGRPDLADDERFARVVPRFHNRAAFDRELEAWLASRTRREVTEHLQAIRIAAAPVNDLPELLSDEHLAARGFWRRFADPAAGDHVLPGPSFRMSATHGAPRRAAPRLGENTREVLAAITTNARAGGSIA